MRRFRARHARLKLGCPQRYRLPRRHACFVTSQRQCTKPLGHMHRSPFAVLRQDRLGTGPKLPVGERYGLSQWLDQNPSASSMLR